MAFNYRQFFFMASLFCLMMGSCKRDDYYGGKDVILSFSSDTLRIDTVFTSRGSATRFVKVYNPKDQPILVDITLKNQTNSFFRINADGAKGPVVKNVEINANDSIYIFVEVTIDPNQPLSTSPFIIEDQIEVDVNGNTSIIHLEAWGQNANYIPYLNAGGSGNKISCELNTITWDDAKPYVIYGILYIDSCSLVLPPGTRIYVHGGVIRNQNSIYNDGLLIFLKNGHLISKGTVQEPVIIQGDRLEEEFKDVKSQWVGLLFWQESKENKLDHTIIKNSIFGVRADSLTELSLYNCQISNTGGPGIIGRFSSIYAENCLIYDNTSYGIQLSYGGNYNFNYCTVGSYEGMDEAVIMTDFYCEEIICGNKAKLNKLKSTFNNCIFSGVGPDEIGLLQASKNDADFDYTFDHCAFKVEKILNPLKHPDFFDHCIDCINLKPNDDLFLDIYRNDYRLDTMSVVRDKGKLLASISSDILGKPRKPVPDMGCYEF